jgi:hypothetical protein
MSAAGYDTSGPLAVITRRRYAHVQSVGRRHACRLGERLQTFGSRRREGGRGTHVAADPLAYLPRDPRWLREGARELVRATTQRNQLLISEIDCSPT